MNKDNKALAIIAGVGAAVAGILLLRKPAEGAMGASVTIKVLDSSGNEVPHGSPIELEAGGSYTVSVTVTNQSTQNGVPVAVSLTTEVVALINQPLATLIEDIRTDSYLAGGSNIFTYQIVTPDFACNGAIGATVYDLPPSDPAHQQLASGQLDFNVVAAKRAAINGMGDLDDDGYVTPSDIAVLDAYIEQSGFYGFDIHSITTLSLWEFVRRADVNCDEKIDAADRTAIENFIATGVLPEPQVGSRPAIDGMGDLNNDGYVSSVDIILCGFAFGGKFPASEISPLSEAELLCRADLNYDGQINILDIIAMNNFINTGQLPQPPQVVYAASVDVGVE